MSGRQGHLKSQPAVLSYVVIGATTVLYASTTISLLRLWNAFGSRYYTHGDMVVVLALLSLMRRRADVPPIAAPLFWGYLVLLALSGVWLLAYLSTIQVAHQPLLPAILILVVYCACGGKVARHFAFPIGFLYFAIPVWQWATPLLQRMTIAAMGVALPMAQIPAIIVGDLVQIPAGNFEIQGGCAGSAYFIVALAVAAYHGDVLGLPMRRRATLLLLAGACAIISNWVRVFTIIVAGQLTAMHAYIVRVSHDGFGWAVFGAGLLLFFGVAGRLPPTADALMVPTLPAAPSDSSQRQDMRRAAFTLLIAALGPAWGFIVSQRALPSNVPGSLLRTAECCSGPLELQGAWHPTFPHATVEQIGGYRSSDAEYAVYVAMFARQSDSAKLQATHDWFDAAESVVGRSEWGGGINSLQLFEVRAGDGSRAIIVTGYAVDNVATGSVAMAQLRYAWVSLTRAVPARAFAIRVACMPECDSARALAVNFWAENPWITKSN